MWSYNYTDELYHHGVKGMKWGVRKKSENTTGYKHDYTKRIKRGHAGPPKSSSFTRRGQLKKDKRDLEELNAGKHLSVGFTKKRQEAYDARDRAILEKRIALNEAKLDAKNKKQLLKTKKKDV